jgi:hypothetical protein
MFTNFHFHILLVAKFGEIFLLDHHHFGYITKLTQQKKDLMYFTDIWMKNGQPIT